MTPCVVVLDVVPAAGWRSSRRWSSNEGWAHAGYRPRGRRPKRSQRQAVSERRKHKGPYRCVDAAAR